MHDPKSKMSGSRRSFLQQSALLLSAPAFLPYLSFQTNEFSRPSLYLTSEAVPGLRSIESLRAALGSGHAQQRWQRVLKAAHSELEQDVLLPGSMFEGRNASAAKHQNADFTICHAAGQRILRAALVALLEQDLQYKESALRQIRALFDTKLWPRWLDDAHLRFELPAGLRTGMLAQDVAFAFDWLHPMLSEAERNEIVAGLDARAIQPFWESVEKQAWWTRDVNNWLAVIVGGLGITGMALRGEHPDADRLVAYAAPQMRRYLASYGPAGEFNESVGYATATRLPVRYFLAERYWSGGRENVLGEFPFPETGIWSMYLTLPPGRLAGFGDSHPDAPVYVDHIAAIAAAAQNAHLQWYYLQYAGTDADPVGLLWYDADLPAKSPEGELPRARVFPAQGGIMVSRTDWAPQTTACVVYGKFGREENHEHHDIGQLCIDGHGERLVIDLGSPSGYPEDFFEETRWQYHNASIRGHNILMFDGQELRFPGENRGAKAEIDHKSFSGKLQYAEFDDQRGAMWQMDLTAAYDGVELVRRTVVHLLPGWVAVLDEALLPKPARVSLRWHLAASPKLAETGAWKLEKGHAQLSAWCGRIDGNGFTDAVRHHEYKAPYDRDRLGDLLEQRREPYYEIAGETKQCRILTLFQVAHREAKADSDWQQKGMRWQASNADDSCLVELLPDALLVKNQAKEIWRAPI